jgi:hypothetical protein
VLWFEHKLFDQIEILQILDWFASPGEGHPGLHLISSGTLEGMPMVRGLGKLSLQQIIALWPDRMPISAPALARARRGWGHLGLRTRARLNGIWLRQIL